MKSFQKRALISSLLLILFASGCNLPILPNNGPSVIDQAATVVALTLQAATTKLPPGSSALTVTDNTNCRSGPGTNYPVVTTIPAGTSVPIVAQYSGGQYWIVEPPDGKGQCWVLGELGKVTGDTSALPLATAVVDKNATIPARPVYFFYHYDCRTAGTLTTTLTWSDSATNETGYHLYRYGVLIAELPANSTNYTDDLSYTPGTNITYDIAAFNTAGESVPHSENFTCQ
jgi:SH3 domain-containing protein